MDAPTPEPQGSFTEAEEVEHLEAVEDAHDVLLAREAMADPAPSVLWSEAKARLGL